VLSLIVELNTEQLQELLGTKITQKPSSHQQKGQPISNWDILLFRYTVVCILQIAYPFQDQIHTLSKMIKTIVSLRYVISFSKKGGPFALWELSYSQIKQ